VKRHDKKPPELFWRQYAVPDASMNAWHIAC
jgi:hypothetical protein